MNNNNETEEVVDELTARIHEENEKSVIPLVEDVAEWISKLMKVKVTPTNFLDELDTGVIILKLAQKIQKHSLAFIEEKQRRKPVGVRLNLKSLPNIPKTAHVNAKKETFFARDNVATFLKWARDIGIIEAELFETDGLVMHKQLKNVVLTFLALARVGARYELNPIPSLIKLEKEIEAEEIDERKNITVRKKKKPPSPTSGNTKVDLDTQVQNYAKRHNVKVVKLREGKYSVNEKLNVFVRILRDHIMVRVGGGWDELDHFLSRHNPEKIGKLLVSTTVRGS